MRVIIFADMEGVAGIQSWEHVGGATPLYPEGRMLYTNEINAAVRGCKSAGATEIIAIDGHGGSFPGGKPFMSWVNAALEPGAKYIQGYPWARYIEPLESGETDCVLFVGAHAMAGVTEGVLCHTVSSETWVNAWINETLVGESGIVAAVAASFGVPSVFVSGDEATCKEVVDLIGPEVVTAPVKKGLGRFSAINLAPTDACDLIESKVTDCLKNREAWPEPIQFASPVTFKVEVQTTDRVNSFIGREHVHITGPRTVEASGDTFWQAWDRFWYRT